MSSLAANLETLANPTQERAASPKPVLVSSKVGTAADCTTTDRIEDILDILLANGSMPA